MSESANLPSAPAPAVHLKVLPHSGKVEELRKAMQEDASSPGSSSPASVPPPVVDAQVPGEDPTRFVNRKLIEGKVIEALCSIYDPEIPVNIYELGLIYKITVNPDDSVDVQMTLTAPACPVAGTLPGEVETRIEAIPEVTSAKVELVWEPAWSKDRMSEAATLQLGFM